MSPHVDHERLAQVGRALFDELSPDAKLSLVALPNELGICLIDSSRGGGKIYVATDESVLFVGSALDFDAFRQGLRTAPTDFPRR